jgi:hypothetical protein
MRHRGSGKLITPTGEYIRLSRQLSRSFRTGIARNAMTVGVISRRLLNGRSLLDPTPTIDPAAHPLSNCRV